MPAGEERPLLRAPSISSGVPPGPLFAEVPLKRRGVAPRGRQGVPLPPHQELTGIPPAGAGSLHSERRAAAEHRELFQPCEL